MEYRKATPDDAEVLTELRKQQLIDEGLLAINNIDTELINYFKESLLDNSFISWLVVDDGRIIATSGLCFYKLPPSHSNLSGKNAYVTNMFTVKEYRRQGIASALLEKILEEARVRGYKVIRLHASTDGQSLYKTFGFVPSEGYMALKFD